MDIKENEVFDNPFLLPKAMLDALEQLEKEEVKEIYLKEGREEGEENERKKQYIEYMDRLPNLMKLLYGNVKTDWLKKLSLDQLNELFGLVSSGISYDELVNGYCKK